MPDRSQPLVNRPVAEIMSRPVVAIPARARLSEALATLRSTDLRHLVVVDDGDRCRGVLSDRAVAAAWAVNASALDCLRVEQALDRRLAVVAATATVGDVARVMDLDRVDAVAVIDSAGRPVGIVTGADLIGLIARHLPAPDPDPAPSEPVGSDASSPEGGRKIR
jgi:CBS domain-containing protein